MFLIEQVGGATFFNRAKDRETRAWWGVPGYLQTARPGLLPSLSVALGEATGWGMVWKPGWTPHGRQSMGPRQKTPQSVRARPSPPDPL